MLKDFIKSGLQKILGYDCYLFIFAVFCVMRIRIGITDKSFKYFMNIIPSEGLILDIGANIGMMSVIFASNFPESEIIAFEPIPSNIKAFKRVTKMFRLKNIILKETALGEKNGKIKMVLPVIKNSRRQGLSHVWKEGITEDWNQGELFTVSIFKLDHLNELHTGKKVAAIKVDVENYEYEVFCGAKEIIEKHQPIIYSELWDNDKRSLCIELLKGMGYDIHIVENNELKVYTDQKEINFIFLPKNYYYENCA
jgi:FkbM family methyltransferase